MLNVMRRARGGPLDSEQGATLVEFALIFPIFMMLVLGMFTGGLAYNQKLTMTAAARETSRYGATLPITPACGPTGSTDLDKWLNCVAAVAVQTATDQLPTNAPGREICVAYVRPSSASASTGSNDLSRHLLLTTSNTGTTENGPCPGAPASSITHRHVQVIMQRDSKIQGLFFTIPLTLTSTSLSRFERA